MRSRSGLLPVLAPLVAMVASLSLSGAAWAKKDTKKKDKEREAAPALLPDKATKAADGGLHTLQVKCSPPGADVYVDGQAIGSAPIDLPVPVTPGDHTIKVVKLGHAPYIDVFSTKNKPRVQLEVELIPISGVLHVTSTVPESRVLVDGKFVGVAPADVEMEVGARAVQVEKGCHKEFFQNVMAVAGKEETIDVKMQPLPQDETNPCYVKPLAPPKWYQKKWVWGVVAGVAVVAAGAAVGGAVAASSRTEFCTTVDTCTNVPLAPALSAGIPF